MCFIMPEKLVKLRETRERKEWLNMSKNGTKDSSVSDNFHAVDGEYYNQFKSPGIPWRS